VWYGMVDMVWHGGFEMGVALQMATAREQCVRSGE
jgi:hypothetical protein